MTDDSALWAGVLPAKVGGIIQERNGSHGDPITNHDHIAESWTDHLGVDGGPLKDPALRRPITGDEVADMMILLKLSRKRVGGFALDHYADAIGYASIAALYVPGYDAAEAYHESVQEAPDEAASAPGRMAMNEAADVIKRILDGDTVERWEMSATVMALEHYGADPYARRDDTEEVDDSE